MTEIVEQLLSKYERGRISRRDLAVSLAVMMTTRARAQPQSAPIAVRTLNHVSISVSDVDKTVDFYQKHFGMRVISREGTPGNPIAGGGGGVVVNLAPGPGPEFIGIYRGNEKPSINHFCLGVQNFDADRVLKTLTDRGVTARMRTRGQSKEIFLTDPDSISVQLTDASYCGGTGLLGNRCSP
jgi:catechol 2,3-dioxygenase-like lactoylglutathione lyase family enzyme